MLRFQFFFICLILGHSLWAQHSSKAYLELADSLYANHNYASAVSYYERALKKAEHPAAVKLKLARSLGKINNIVDAEKWFKEAQDGGATFSNDDVYEFARILVMLKKGDEAENLLETLAARDPNALYAKRWILDLQHYSNYFNDSSLYVVKPLSINTPQSEFAPVFYKNGIVFTGAQPEKILQKKYHWDNSHFLNLYFSKKINNNEFAKPELFEKELNSKYHDGPVSFYNNFNKMILNRNKSMEDKTKKNTWHWHLGLFEGYQDKDSSWIITPLPFDHPPYSFAHPHISEDGNVLFFVSDKPGGYGGTDIYKTTKVNGKWSAPFNLGPLINTSGNETFPFQTGNTLYFSSNGHGGLGGMDIFTSTQSVNGFTPPVNLGYPINSHLDDFSIITSTDQTSGYFASNRSGNDDLFSFNYLVESPPVEIPHQPIKMAAHVFNETDQSPLSGARVQIITFGEPEVELVADDQGIAEFTLPDGTAYMIIGTKGNLAGMNTGVAEKGTDKNSIIHPVPARDTLGNQVPIVGLLTDKDGRVVEDAKAKVTDKISGEEIESEVNDGVVSFMGEKDHDYNIVISHKDSNPILDELHVSGNGLSAEKFSVVLDNIHPVKSYAATQIKCKAFKEDTNEPLPFADAKIITLVDDDAAMTTDSLGFLSFNLPNGLAYVVLVNQGEYSGMLTEITEQGTSKELSVHPIVCRKLDDNQVNLITKIHDDQNRISASTHVMVTDKETQESIAAELKNGLLSFIAEKGHYYTILLEDPTGAEEIAIKPTDDKLVYKEIYLQDDKSKKNITAASISLLDENKVPILDGVVVIAEKQSGREVGQAIFKNGLLSFEAQKGTIYSISIPTPGKPEVMQNVDVSIPHTAGDIFKTTVQAKGSKDTDMLPVTVLITNNKHEILEGTIVAIIDKATGQTISTSIDNGKVSFLGKKGSEYVITVSHTEYESVTEEILIPIKLAELEEFTLTLTPKKSTLDFLANVFKAEDKTPLGGAQVKVISMFDPDLILSTNKDGLVDYKLEEGIAYVLIADKDNYTGMYTGMAELDEDKIHTIHPVPTFTNTENKIPVITRVTDDSGSSLNSANISVKNKANNETVPSDFMNGILTFYGENEMDYSIIIEHGNTVREEIVNLNQHDASPKLASIAISKYEESISVIAHVTDEDNLALKDTKIVVTDNSSGRRIPVTYKEANISFDGKKGNQYTIIAEHPNYIPARENLFIPNDLTQSPEVNFKLKGLQIDPSIYTMAVRIYKEENNAPLGGANIKVITMGEADQEFIANDQGIVEFNLPKGIAYVVIGEKDGYSGMHSGLAESGTDKRSIIHAMPASKAAEGKSAVLGLLADENGHAVSNARVIVTDINGEAIPFTVQNSILFFEGNENEDYRIQVVADGYEPWEESLHLSPNQDNRLKINLTSSTYALASKTNTTTLPQTSTVIIVNNNKEASRIFVHDGRNDSIFELIEKDGELFLKSQSEVSLIGRGNLASMRQQPSKLVQLLGASEDQVMNIQNIYFNFNEYKLNRDNEKDLNRVASLLSKFSSIKLTISAHADDRGSENYNLRLSRRRARSVENYLISHGIAPTRIRREGFGEKIPAVPCPPEGCSEEDHQKNRRAEFGLIISPTTLDEPVQKEPENSYEVKPVVQRPSKTTTKPSGHSGNNRYQTALEEYGSKRVDGLEFKVTIGAYRYNHTLTFDELADIGTMEKVHENGITYYYLGIYTSLQEMENARQQAIQRGITDASFRILYNGEKIDFTKFLSLVQ